MTRHQSRKCRQPRSLAAPRGRHALYHLSLAKYWAETPQQVSSIMYLACAMCIVQTLTVQRCREVGSCIPIYRAQNSGASIINNDKIKIETLETHKSRCLVLYIWSLFWRHVATCEQCVVWCLAIGWVILFSIEQSGRVFCGVFTPSCWPSHSHPAPHHRHYTITTWCFLLQTRISSYPVGPPLPMQCNL